MDGSRKKSLAIMGCLMWSAGVVEFGGSDPALGDGALRPVRGYAEFRVEFRMESRNGEIMTIILIVYHTTNYGRRKIVS